MATSNRSWMVGSRRSEPKSRVFTLLLTLLIAATCLHQAPVADGELQVGFYDSSCAIAESIVKRTIRVAVSADRTIAASLIRLHFHDCFVNGCDASNLLTGSGTEQTAIPNLTIRGYSVITDAKAQLEANCPGVVSCADLLALAARDSVEILGGAFYHAETGRSDGTAAGTVNLPGPNMTVEEVTPFFTNLGLTQDDMVVLTGSHTVGVTQCMFFVDRLYNFKGTGKPDPSLDMTFLAKLQSLCPNVTGDTTNVALDDNSEFSFDRSYFRNLQANKGVLRIDEEIANDPSTRGKVNSLAASSPRQSKLGAFDEEFGLAMIAMGRIGVLTSGHVRAVCELP